MRKTKTVLIAAAAALVASGAAAQLVGDTLRGYDRSAPIDFAADRIEVLEAENQALFTGSVEVTQGSLALSAGSIRVLYEDSGELTVSRLIAEGSVRLRTNTERATARRAIYDVPRSIVTLYGDVQVNRGTDRLTGERLVIDLDSGSSSIGGAGRVTGSFTPATE
ncbi:MAG: LptA/OstA family protein [Pacificimonas sp.]|jgi:lipopolysaccharide export system protein LptA|nr:LptA/OstA family protein [Pacificimonas sp.]